MPAEARGHVRRLPSGKWQLRYGARHTTTVRCFPLTSPRTPIVPSAWLSLRSSRMTRHAAAEEGATLRREGAGSRTPG